MYCIFSREAIRAMNGNRGKLAAQAGHAYLHAWWDALRRAPMIYGVGHPSLPNHYNPYEYEISKATKICLVTETTDELRALEQAYRPICGTSLVTDAGLTCFNEPTTTCLGIGPIRNEDIGEDLKALKVLI